MKNVLITGANSYIGTEFANWIKENEKSINCHTIDMRSDKWRQFDFSKYDSVFHVAGLAHADVGKVTEEEKQNYYRINCELAYETAKTAKEAGVSQFIYMSSIIVYGDSAAIGRSKTITANTEPKPSNFYGDSKLKAEERLHTLSDESFKIVILRPPMIYGKNSKGNYPLLAKMAKKLPIFPQISNSRSMLYNGNLNKFVSLMIINDEEGIFFPQNESVISTSDMVGQIANVSNKKVVFTKVFNPLIRLISKTGTKPGKLLNKAFGSLTYDMELSKYKENYVIYNFEESVKLTEV